jgi:hypothetical protein
VCGPEPTVAFEQFRRAIDQEREQQAFRLGQIEGALEGTPGGARVAERVAGDRVEQESLNLPKVRARHRRRTVEDGRQSGDRRVRVVLGEPQRRRGDAHLATVALRTVHLGQELLDPLRLARQHERLQPV